VEVSPVPKTEELLIGDAKSAQNSAPVNRWASIKFAQQYRKLHRTSTILGSIKRRFTKFADNIDHTILTALLKKT
jgi:hypothetical protein